MNMKKMFNLIPMLTLFLGCFSMNAQAQEINMVDEQNFYEIQENSEGVSLIVTIDGIRKVADYGEDDYGILPKYLGKYKNALVFMEEASQKQRNILVFRPINGTVWQSTYENVLCNRGEREECLMFYGDTPLKVEFNRVGGPKTKFTKADSKYAKFKGHTISGCDGEFTASED